MEENLLTICEISTLYFLKGMNQQDIAKKFNISRMSVSRILQQAKDLNIVEITVKPPFEFNRELETKIINSSKIKSVYVVINKTGEDLRSLLGKVGAFYVCMNLKEGDIIGVSVGMTIARLIENIIPRHTSGVKVVQLMGGFGNVREYEAFDIVQKKIKKINRSISSGKEGFPTKKCWKIISSFGSFLQKNERCHHSFLRRLFLRTNNRNEY